MIRAAPLRFLAGVLLLWTSARMVMLERPDAAAVPLAAASAYPPAAPLMLAAARDPPAGAPRVPLRLAIASATAGATPTGPLRVGRAIDGDALMLLLSYASTRDGGMGSPDGASVAVATADDSSATLLPGVRAGAPLGTASALDTPFVSVAPSLLRPLRARWSGEAYLFARGGGSGTDATAGTLGGGQAAARIAYRVDQAGRVALFARGYAPLHGKGSEVSGGVEWHPLDGVPLRLAVERRQRTGAGGRSAWQASAAGGVDAAPLPGGLRLDAYAQAGVVGARARDLFADGSVRVGRALPVATGSVTVGGGAWGAAQPGVSRLDLGPQAALRLPEGATALTLALDWRLRAAGHARPGSGPALTLAADF